jgi:hypothetical protein
MEAGGVNLSAQDLVVISTALVCAIGNAYLFVAAVHDGHRGLYRAAGVAFFVFSLGGRVLCEGAVRSTWGNTAALDQLLLESYGSKVGRGLALELQRVRNLPDVRNLYLPRSSPISERTVRIVKFCRNRENM